MYLTKDNLTKKGAGWGTKYVFCGANETVDHLFLHCSLAKFQWSILQCTFNLNSVHGDVKNHSPHGIQNLERRKR